MECLVQDGARLGRALEIYNRSLELDHGFTDHDCPVGILREVVASVPESLQDAFIFVGAAHFRYANRPAAFHDLAGERLTREDAVNLAVAWFVRPRGKGGTGSRLPAFIRDKFGPGAEREVLCRVMVEAPEDSDAYVEAARLLLEQARSSVAIQEFRDTWNLLSPERREAIAVELNRVAWDPEGVDGHLAGSEIPSRLELLVGEVGLRTRAAARVRWIDQVMPGLRPVLWEAFSDACGVFSSSGGLSNHEIVEVGNLLDHVVQILRGRSALLSRTLAASLVQGSVRFSLERYVFRPKREMRRRSDLSLVFRYRQHGGIAFARHVILKAGHLERGALRLTGRELRDFLKCSVHGGFYVAWEAGGVPRCVPVSLVQDAMELAQRSGIPPFGSSRLEWRQISGYGDRFDEFIGDRFLCGEVGDPVPEVWGEDGPGVAAGIATSFGPPRQGVLVVSIESTAASTGPSVNIPAQPSTISVA